MKVFNSIIKLTVATAITSGIVLSSSCKKLDETGINEDQKQLPYGPYVPGAYLTSMMQSIIKNCPVWWAQVQQNLNADIYSGYMMSSTAFGGNILNNTTYAMKDGWNGFAFNTPNNDVLNRWLEVKAATETKNPDLYGISLILKVFAAHRMADAFGPIVYTQYGQGKQPAADNLKDLYNAFFTDLTKAAELLTKAEDANPTADLKVFAPYDVSTLKGDYKKWVQLANALRLRLAMRISAADPSTAKSQAEAAVGHKWGVLGDTRFAVSPGDCGVHFLSVVSNGWNDISLGAPMECFLNGYSDPRGAKYALPASDADPAIKGKIKGIRNGVDTKTFNYKGYSYTAIAATELVMLMSGAESHFLRAEGAVKGWNMGGGSAKSFYESGITQSFGEVGASGAAAYIADGTSKPTPYVDPKNPANNIPTGSPYLSTITIKWDDAASQNEKLERIITQKWLAGFPEGQEAWSEFRRTGYPKLFPVVVDNSGENILQRSFPFIRRLIYPSTFSTTNSTGYNSAVSSISGGDKIGSALWWDKN